MNKTLIGGLLLAGFASFAAHAQDTENRGGWSGSGEFGFASSTGNSRSENINAKLGLSQENDQWKNNFFVDALRSKSEQKIVDTNGNTIEQFNTTANRYDAGASVGLKLDTRSYIVGAARYEHDDFGANLWQGTVSLGYGYIALKDERNELSFEIGPGYKRSQPKSFRVVNTATIPPGVTTVNPAVETQAIGRSLVNFKHRITDNTRFEDTLLAESGTQNTFYQNEAGLAVSMTKTLALKLGYETRYNSEIAPGAEHSDQLFTTNLVYSFSGSK